ncbi:MAG: VWA domain-containing protein [Acidobacteriaceae bacterium]|nr:VWA domain-containing protein [Acidobacteriaceae bacterium]MBV9497789.1 VWA domain-containing protein [Acidobacteriaceae bacterium]
MNLFLRSLLILVVIFAAVPEFGQDITFEGEVNLVEVYATVFDHDGQTVAGLSKDQFAILDNGKARQIRAFEPTYRALSCALLLDTTGSMKFAMPALINGARDFISALRPGDSVGLYAFTDHLEQLQEMSTDREASAAVLTQLRVEGRTALFDSIAELAVDLEKRPGKKAIVVLTDGGDNASVLNREAAVASARKAGVPIFAVAEGEALHDDTAADLLRDLAEATGGRMYKANHSKQIGTVFQAVGRYLQNGYLLAFQAPTEAKGKSWHDLQVVVKNAPEPLKVRARTGYSIE